MTKDSFDIQRIRQERNTHLDTGMFRPVRVEGQRNSDGMTNQWFLDVIVCDPKL